MPRLWQQIVPPLVALIIVMLGWQLGVSVSRVPAYVLPGPLAVVSAAVTNWRELARSFSMTALQALCGFSVSVVLGVSLAMAFTLSRPLRRGLYPLIVGLQAIPVLAFAPLVILWNGFGFSSVVLISFLLSVVPIVVSTFVGLQSVKPEFMVLFGLCGASRWVTLWKLRIPTAWPYFFTGARTACGLAVIGAVVGEQFVGDQRSWPGLGQLIMSKYNVLKVADLFATVFATILLSALGWLLVSLVARQFATAYHYVDGENA